MYLSPELVHASMSTADATRYMGEQATKFAKETPEYEQYRSNENADTIAGYLRRNGIGIADSATFAAAFVRLRDLGILKPTPVPVTQAAHTPVQPQAQTRYVTREPEQPKGPQMWLGRDPETGLDKSYTMRQVERMSSEHFARCFPVMHDKSLRELAEIARENHD